MIPNSSLPRLMGPGGYLSYRIMRHCMYFSFVWLLYSVLVVVPIFYCQGSFGHGFSVILDNIIVTKVFEGNPSHIWVIVISAYILCGYWVILIYSEWQIVKETRIGFEHSVLYEHVQSTYSLMVQTASDESSTAFAASLSKLLGPCASDVQIIAPILNTSRLHRLMLKRYWYTLLGYIYPQDKKIDYLNEAIVKENEGIRKRAAVDLRITPTTGRTESVLQSSYSYSIATSALMVSKTIDFPEPTIGTTTVRTTSALLRSMSRLLVSYRLPTYFVTFTTMRSRTLLAQMFRVQSEMNTFSPRSGNQIPLMVPAPTPADIIWENIDIDEAVTRARKLLVRALLVLVAAAFAYPIVLVQDAVRRFHFGGSDEQTVSWMREIIVLYTAPCIQVALWHIIPAVLRIVSSNYERHNWRACQTRGFSHLTCNSI